MYSYPLIQSSLYNSYWLQISDLKPTPTAKLERTNDTVYEATTCVVRAVMVLSQGVQSKSSSSSASGNSNSPTSGKKDNRSSKRSSQSASTNHLENVKNVGVELRRLLSAVDSLVPSFPTTSHREVNNFYTVVNNRAFSATSK